MQKSDLIIHPVRFRILRAIGREDVTTQQIAERLPDVPKSSIYRHLKLLLDGEMVVVAEMRLVNGIQEKVYRVAQRPYLSAEDVQNLSADEHVDLFATYVMTLLQGFSLYAHNAEAKTGKVDMVADRVGYTEVAFYATLAEFDQLQQSLNEAIVPLLKNESGNGRVRRKLSFLTHPVDGEIG